VQALEQASQEKSFGVQLHYVPENDHFVIYRIDTDPKKNVGVPMSAQCQVKAPRGYTALLKSLKRNQLAVEPPTGFDNNTPWANCAFLLEDVEAIRLLDRVVRLGHSQTQ
jgi:hypothetical protein